MTWTSVPGMTYRIEGTTDLTDPMSWVDLTGELMGDPSTTTAVVDLTLHPAYPTSLLFLRVVALP